MKKVLLCLVPLGLIVWAVVSFASNPMAGPPTAKFRTVAVTRGSLLSTISATGTLEPEEVVNVGTQVSGLIVAFGDDPRSPSGFIDYCSVVEKGAVLANIDPTPYEAALEQAEANLEQAEAIQIQCEVKARKAERDWQRASRLGHSPGSISPTDYDAAQSDHDTARASLAAAKAAVRQNKAAVKTARTNLGYCAIQSPVRGTIIDRRVNIGQTVVASFNAPSLFLIAKDLERMQVWASVNEADIGRIRVGMPARFTVDARGGETFPGSVTQIRMNAQMTQNVVTYTVVVTADNSSGKLLPYLTANVQFELAKRAGVLLVPDTALRWSPDADQVDPLVDPAALSSPARDRGRLWVVAADGRVRPVDVAFGASDGTMTEVSAIVLEEGMRVVVGDAGELGGNVGGDDAQNPFLPKLPKGSKPPPGPM